jgi:hypothetical protein
LNVSTGLFSIDVSLLNGIFLILSGISHITLYILAQLRR